MAQIFPSNEDRESIRFLPTTGRAIITKRSPFSGKFHRMVAQLTDVQYSEWLAGELIQNALSHLSAEEREFLITGITPQEQDATFKKEA